MCYSGTYINITLFGSSVIYHLQHLLLTSNITQTWESIFIQQTWLKSIMYLSKGKMKCKCYQGLLSIDTTASKQQSDQTNSGMPKMNWISFSGKSACKCLGPVLHLRLQCSIRFVRWYYTLPICIRKHSESSWYMKLKIRKAKRNT